MLGERRKVRKKMREKMDYSKRKNTKGTHCVTVGNIKVLAKKV